MKFIKRLLRLWHLKFALKNFPLFVTHKILVFKRIYIKKGKIREWRIYDNEGKRIKSIPTL